MTIKLYPKRRVLPGESSRTQLGVTNFGLNLDRTTLHPEIDPVHLAHGRGHTHGYL